MSKKNYLILFCIFSIYIIYGTTIPFDFTWFQIVLDKIKRLSWIPFDSICTNGLLISDIVQNVLFFIPVGLFGMLRFSNARKISPIIGIIFYGFLLSTIVEAIQLFSLTRNTSVTDIATNTIGTAVGVAVALLGTRLRLFEKIKIPQGKETQFLQLILIIMFVDKLRPFDLSLNISYMHSKLFSLQNNVNELFAFGNNDIWNLMITAIFTYLAVENSRLFKKTLSQLFLLLSLALPFCLEIAKIIVVSRNPDLHNMIIAFAGIISGLSAYSFVYWKKMYSGILLISGVFISAVLKITQSFRLEADNFSDYATYHSYNVMMNLSGYMGLFTLFAVGGFIIDYYLKKKAVNITFTMIMIIIATSEAFTVKGDWIGAVVCIAALGIGKGVCGRMAL